ncbi:MAG: hypothetical protein WCA46_16140 [Actinocatenispora sp.]
MLEAQLTGLLDDAAPGVDEALGLVAGFDDCLVHGFARLGEERAATLAAMAGALAGTPLGERVGDAVGKISAGSVGDEHLTALAGARTALLGAVHDSLLGGLDAALGRTREPWAEPAATVPDPTVDNLLTGCRSWLHELAVAGWHGVDQDLVSTSGQLLEGLLAEPRLRRLAVLVDGLAAELRASSPIGTMDHLPVRRWADLWTRALLLSQTGVLPGFPAASTVSGRLLILGVDVHEHATAVQIQVHGLLEPADGSAPRSVRTSVAAAKVDTIVGPAVWQLFGAHPVLLGALARQHGLDVTDLPLLGSGDLVWHDDRASVGEPADPFATARVLLAGATAPAVPPLERHPVRISEPVLVEGYKATLDKESGVVTLALGGARVAVDPDRFPACGPLTPKLVAGSSACVGLLRWDAGRWLLQPLAVRTTVKKVEVAVHGGDWALGPTDPKVAKAQAKAGDAVDVLRERAGRLLRR